MRKRDTHRRGQVAIMVWIALVTAAAYWAAARGDAGALPSGAVPPLLVTAIGIGAPFAWMLWLNGRAHRHYAIALRAEGPEPLVARVGRSMKLAFALPAVDVFTAQSTAIAYALFGREEEALRALAATDWKGRQAPVQAIGLSAEGLVELLCRRDAGRGLELMRRARALAGVVAPGAVRYYGTCVGLGEALQGSLSPESAKVMEQAVAQPRQPALRVLASFGLAVAAERAGDAARARQFRAIVDEMAPYAAPLRLGPEAFATSPVPAPPGPVSVTLSEPGATLAPPPAASRGGAAKKTLFLWCALLVMFLLIWFFLTPSAGQ